MSRRYLVGAVLFATMVRLERKHATTPRFAHVTGYAVLRRYKFD